MEEGEAVAYAIWQLQDRGQFLIPPHTRCYMGMIVGINNRDNDIIINIQRKKQLTNVRSANKDDAILIIPHIQHGLEQSLEFIEDDELVEVTPQSIRLRKRLLVESQRKLAEKKTKAS
jgi:GTP-binding protein